MGRDDLSVGCCLTLACARLPSWLKLALGRGRRRGFAAHCDGEQRDDGLRHHVGLELLAPDVGAIAPADLDRIHLLGVFAPLGLGQL